MFFIMLRYTRSLLFFFFNDTATTEIYTLSLHDALPISDDNRAGHAAGESMKIAVVFDTLHPDWEDADYKRSEEHTSELQSPDHLVCRLLLEKKKKQREVQKYSLRNVQQ